MSYIKIEFGGKERGFKFNDFAKDELIREAYEIKDGQVIQKYSNESAFKILIFYVGLLGNCFAKKEIPDFTFDDVDTWFSSVSKEVKDMVVNTFVESEAYKNAISSNPPAKQEKGQKKRNIKA